jgi:hypothetical protein
MRVDNKEMTTDRQIPREKENDDPYLSLHCRWQRSQVLLAGCRYHGGSPTRTGIGVEEILQVLQDLGGLYHRMETELVIVFDLDQLEVARTMSRIAVK